MHSLPLRHQNPDSHPAQRVLLGLGVIAAGAMALLDRQQVFELPLLRSFWPLALVLLGLARLTWPRQAGGLFGLALIAVGSLLTARNLGYTGFSLRDWWPVFVIGAGLTVLLGGAFPRRSAALATLIPGDRIALDASFSNLNQRSESPGFIGGHVDLSFGSLALDLSQATMAGPEAVLEISARFSSIELRLPRGWQVVSDMAITAGGITDRTAPTVLPTHRLILRGQTLFGGIAIGN